MATRIEIKADDVLRNAKQVKRFLSKVTDIEELGHAIGLGLVAAVQMRFEKGEGPDKQRWKPSARGGQTLVDTGGLRDSINHRVKRHSVLVGTNKIYAGIHQFGGVIKAKDRKALAFSVGGKPMFRRKVTIPARPFLGFNDDTTTEVRNAMADFIRLARDDAKRAGGAV